MYLLKKSCPTWQLLYNFFLRILEICMKLVLTIINNFTDLPKVVAKSSYPSSRNSQALPTSTVTSGKEETWFYKVSQKQDFRSISATACWKTRLVLMWTVWFVVYSICFPMTAKTGLKQHGKAQGRAQRKGCKRQPAGNKWSSWRMLNGFSTPVSSPV